MNPVDPDQLRPADSAEVAAALAHALTHAAGSRRRTTDAAELMVRIVADELMEALNRNGSWPHADKGVLAAITYEQPITRGQLSERFGRDRALIAPGPRATTPGAPFAYVTTEKFWRRSGSKLSEIYRV